MAKRTRYPGRPTGGRPVAKSTTGGSTMRSAGLTDAVEFSICMPADVVTESANADAVHTIRRDSTVVADASIDRLY